MIIGVDIDDTLTDIRDKIKEEATKYTKQLGKEEKIDIFIDDQLANCMKVSNEGIKVIRITDYKEKHGNIINKSNWEEIYKYINEME